MQRLAPFKLERYFARYEFTTRHLLCCSDPEALSLSELLQQPAAQPLLPMWNELGLGYTESAGVLDGDTVPMECLSRWSALCEKF